MRIGVEVRVLHLTLDELGPFVQCHTQTPKGQRPRPAPARRLDPPRCRRPRRSSASQPSPHRCRGRTRTRATQAIQVGISRSCPNVVAMPSPVSFGMSASPACLLRRTLDDRRLALRSTDGVRGRTRRCLPRHPTGGRGRRQDRPPAARAASSMKLSTAQLVQPGPTER
jgi:hypothetical protein